MPSSLVTGVTLGDTSAVSGGAAVVNAAQSATPAGLLSLAFGDPIVDRGESGASLVLDLSGSYLAPPATAVALPLSGAPLILGSVGSLTQFGAASLANAAQAIYPQSIQTPGIGSARVMFDVAARELVLDLTGAYTPDAALNVGCYFDGKPLTAGVSAGNTALFGLATIVNPPAVLPNGIAPGALGVAIVNRGESGASLLLDLADGSQTLYPVRLDFTPSERPVVSVGTMTALFGGASVRNAAFGIAPPGFQHETFGQPRAFFYTFGFPLSMLFVGDYSVPKPPVQMAWPGDNKGMFPVGIAPKGFGETFVNNTALGIGAFGFEDFQGFGVQTVSLGIRRLYAGLGDQSGFGDTFVSAGNRTLDLADRGIAPSGLGTTTVWFALRQVFPAWFVATLWGSAKVDRTHFVDPAGFTDEQVPVPDVHYPRFIIDLTDQGIDSASFGATQLELFTQYLRPKGWLAPAKEEPLRFGMANIYNSDQYLFQLFAPSPYDGGTFGHFNYVENKNKTITQEGFDLARYGRPYIFNNGRFIQTPRFQDFSAFGNTLVAPYVRNLSPVGVDMIGWGSSLGNIIYNAARVIAPAAMRQDGYGKPSLASNLQKLREVGADSSVFGDAMVAFAIRALGVYGIRGDFPLGNAHVSNWQRYLSPKGMDAGGRGVPTLEIHFTIFKPKSVLPPVNQFGINTVRNVTPQLYQFGFVQTEWGKQQVFNQHESYAFQGFDSSVLGNKNVVAFRTRVLLAYGRDALYIPTTLQVRNVNPQPPGQQVVTVDGYATAALGLPTVRGNAMFPQGYVATLFGRPQLVAMGIIGQGIPPPYGDNGTQFGTATLYPAQFDYPKGWEGIGWGLPDVGPRYVWAPKGYPYTTGYWGEIGEQMDQWLHGTDHPERPVFGSVLVAYRNRPFFPSGLDLSDYGLPRVSLNPQYLHATGNKLQKLGFPVLNGGGAVQTYGLDQALLGEPDVAIHYTGPQTALPDGFEGLQFGVNAAENFNRPIYPQGWNQFTTSPPAQPSWPRISTWVSNAYDPFQFSGREATLWGDAWVSFYVRSIYPQGTDTSIIANYQLGHFKDRMRVYKRDYISSVSLGLDEVFGSNRVSLHHQLIYPQAFGGEALGRASLKPSNKINLTGFETLVAGNPAVAYIERLLAAGFDAGALGTPTLVRALDAAGFGGETFGVAALARTANALAWLDDVFGLPALASRLDATGFGEEAFGLLVLGRALGVAGFSDEALGVPLLSRTLGEQSWQDDVFGLAALALRLEAQGFDDEAFGALALARAVAAQGFAAGAAGAPALGGKAVLAALGFGGEAFGADAVTGRNTIAPAGDTAGAAGSPALASGVHPASWLDELVGDPAVTGTSTQPSSWIYPLGWDQFYDQQPMATLGWESLVVGDAGLSAILSPTGIYQGDYGLPQLDQALFPNGFVGGVGIPSVVGDRYLQPDGWADSMFGSIIVKGIDTLLPAGITDEAFGEAALARDMQVVGFTDESFGLIGFARTLDLSGFTDEGFGAASVAAGSSSPSAPAFKAAGASSGTRFGSFTVTSPNLAVNDICLLFAVSTSADPATPSGWTLCAGCPVSSVSPRYNVYWKRATAAGTITVPVGSRLGACGGVIYAYSGCVTSGDPTEAGAGSQNASSTTVTMPSVTTLGPNRLVVMSAGITANSGAPSTISNAVLASLATRTNVAGNVIGDGTLAAAGASGVSTATVGTAGTSSGHTIALRSS